MYQKTDERDGVTVVRLERLAVCKPGVMRFSQNYHFKLASVPSHS
jgi:hypothetical protein